MNSYIVNKNLIFKIFPDLTFIEKYGFKFSICFEEFLVIDIDNEVLLNRIIKISKLKNENLVIGDFLIHIKENEITTRQLMKYINEKSNYKEKYEQQYNVINHEWVFNKKINYSRYTNI